MGIDVLICTVGSRGDVQPFVILAKLLQASGASVVLLAHSEFREFVEGSGVQWEEMRESMPHRVAHTEEGRALRNASPFNAMKVAKAFFWPALQAYFDDTLAAARKYAPHVLVLATFPFLAGGFMVPAAMAQQAAGAAAAALAAEASSTKEGGLEGGVAAAAAPPRIVVVHTVPAMTTREFAPATAGLGLTTWFKWLNKFIWSASQNMSVGMFSPAYEAAMQRHGIKPPVPTSLEFVNDESNKILYIYSPSVLPRPSDWGPQHMVVGSILQEESTDASPLPVLPGALTAFIAAARTAERPVVYVGLGSMLAVMFSEEGEQREVLHRVQEGLADAARKLPKGLAAIVHTVTGMVGEHVAVEGGGEGGGAGPLSLLWLTEPVAHVSLLPLLDVVVHHGGAGTTHSVLAAGKPAVIVPAAPNSDQPFWADVLSRTGAALKSKRTMAALKAADLSALVVKALGSLVPLTAAAQELGERVRGEAGGAATARIVLEELAAAKAAGRPHGK